MKEVLSIKSTIRRITIHQKYYPSKVLSIKSTIHQKYYPSKVLSIRGVSDVRFSIFADTDADFAF